MEFRAKPIAPLGGFRRPSPVNQLVGRRCMFCRMEERSPIFQATGPCLPQPICRRQRESNIHILRPTQRMSGNDYERVLDLGPFLQGTSFDVSRIQNGIDSPTEPRPDLRKGDEDFVSSLGDQEHGYGAPPRGPVLDDLSPGSSSDSHGPPPWSRTCFKLDYPFPACASPLPPFFPHPSRDNARPASDIPSPLDLEDFSRYASGHGCSNDNQRKSCEYCRFRKKKCSGHIICNRCFRVGIECVYMPDLIAKRMVDGLLETPSLSPGTYLPYPAPPSPGATSSITFDGGQLPRGDLAYSCVASSSFDDCPVETPTQPSGRGTKRRKRAANRKRGATKRQKSSRAELDRTRSTAPNIDQSASQSHGLNSAAAGLGPIHVELAFYLAGGVFGMAPRDVDFRNAVPRRVGFDVLDRETHTIPVPKRWDIVEPHEVFGDTATTQPGYTENSVHIPQPTPIATHGWFAQPGPSLDVDLTKAEAVPTSGFDVFPLLETGPSLEPFTVSILSLSPPSAPPPSSGPAVLPDVASDHDPTDSWTMDDWLAWYDSNFFS